MQGMSQSRRPAAALPTGAPDMALGTAHAVKSILRSETAIVSDSA